MAIIYEEDFDELPEGQSPPTGWIKDTVTVLDNCEVDDVQAHSSPHSMFLKSKVAAAGICRHEEVGGFSTERVKDWIYFPDTTHIRIIFTQETTGNSSVPKMAAYIQFDSSSNIKYYDGSWKDTGYNYAAGWHEIEIVHDLATDTFNLWYDSVLIATGAGFRNVVSTLKALHLYLQSFSDSLWVDDVQFGEASGWEGKYLGVTNPSKVNSVAKDNIAKVDGVPSA